MKELLYATVAGLVDNPQAIRITEETVEDGTIVLHLSVAPEDMGRVIGKQGRIAKAVRVIMRAAAARTHNRVMVEIEEAQQQESTRN